MWFAAPRRAEDRKATGMPFADTTLWIPLVAGLGAATGALILSALVFTLLSRSRNARGRQLAEGLEASNARLEERLTALEQELEQARDEGRRSRQLSGIGASIELDTVLSRTLEAAGGIAAVDAATIVLPDADGTGPLVATFGMTAEEAAHHSAAGPPPRPDAPVVEIAYRHGPEHDATGETLIRGGLVLPLPGEENEPGGSLAVFWRGVDGAPTGAEVAALEQLAASAGPAIANARRFREARKLADLDALTSLHNRRYFHDTLAREVARAQRYDRRLALVVLDIDDFKSINERVGHLAGDSVLSQLAERMRSVVRGADIACRVGGDEFAIVLPESGLADAEELYRRLQLAVTTRPTGAAERLHLSAGIAELTPGDDVVSFFERADEALFRAKETGKGRAVAAEGGNTG
jgi:diguanylate cyclase (GGDEF)-like protein